MSCPSCKVNTVVSIGALLLLSYCMDLSMVLTLFIMAFFISFMLFRVAFSSASRYSLALAIEACNLLITLSLGSVVSLEVPSLAIFTGYCLRLIPTLPFFFSFFFIVADAFTNRVTISISMCVWMYRESRCRFLSVPYTMHGKVFFFRAGGYLAYHFLCKCFPLTVINSIPLSMLIFWAWGGHISLSWCDGCPPVF